MIEILSLVILGIVGTMLAVTIVNVLTFPPLRLRGPSGPSPRVSVLIPARNEAERIGPALESLLAQEYPDFEVLVLDDNSDDGTSEVVSRIASGDRRVRLLRGGVLEEGWGGKAFACHQLSSAAGGDLFLFVDADTRHGRDSIAAGVQALHRSGADLLSVIPHQRMVTPWEKILLPLLAFSTFCYLPMILIRRTRDPRLAMANGQYMLFRRGAYESIGGHAAVRTALVEDVWLARLVKQRGFVLEVMDGAAEVSCRMYSSFRGIWEGFSKNLFAGFRYSVPAIGIVALLNLGVSVLPPVLAAALPLAVTELPDWYGLVLWQVLGLALIRVLLALRFRMEFWPVLFHPAAVLILVGMMANSVRWGARGALWKGRIYDFRDGTGASRPAVQRGCPTIPGEDVVNTGISSEPHHQRPVRG